MTIRRRWLLWAALAYAGVLVATAVGLGALYRTARDRLDDALGQRLQAVATATVHLVDGDAIVDWAFDPVASTDLLWLVSRLERIRDANDLAEITLCDQAGFVVASASGRVERGAPNVFWDLDRSAVELALAGAPSVSRLYRGGDLYQKSAHAPVFDRDGAVAGVLTVEGDADFFGALAGLRRGAWLTVALVLGFLTVMGALLLGIHRSLERTRTSLDRQERLATMGRMTAGIAHEIRNPLGIIRGSAEHLQRVLRDRGIDDPVAAFIPEEVDRLDRILARYLALGRDDPGEMVTLDLRRLAARTVRLVRDEFAASGQAVALAPGPDPDVRGDAPRLQQVVLNLLLNARDAMPDGGRIEVSVACAADHATLVVRDQGAGFDDAHLARAFEPFWTTKDRGSGLGLAVSRRIARAHDGELTLANRNDGRGAEAVLALPRAHPGEA